MAAGGPGRGRGAIIAKLLELEQRPGPPTSSSTAGGSPPVQEAVQVPLPRSSGRGAILRRIQQIQAETITNRNQQTPITPTPQPADPLDQPPVPRGRGKLLMTLGLQSQPSLPAPRVTAPTPLQRVLSHVEPPPPAVVASTTPEVTSVTKQFRRIQIDANREPSINRGTTGQEVPATANYIHLYLKEGRGIYEYEVRFNPPVDDRIYCEKLLFVQHRDLFGRNRTFDGVTMYLPRKLDEVDTILTSVHPITNETHTISLIFKKERSMGECTHMFNVLFSIIQRELNMVKLDREYFSKDRSYSIPQHKLEIWPGYVTAVDAFEGGIMLNCNSSNKVLRTQTVLDVIKDILSRGGGGDWKTVLERMLIGQSVMTMRPVNIYRIDDIDFSQNPKSTFEKADGTVMDYVEYHRRKDIQIHDFQQPLLVHRPKPSKRPGGTGLLMLIPELCYMTGLTDEFRNDFKVIKDVSMYTRVNPNQRQRLLQDFIDSIKNSPACVKLLDEWGLAIPERSICLTARTLPPEKIFFGRNFEDMGSCNADWSRAASSQQMLEVVNINNWLVLYTQRDEVNSRNFVEMMAKVCPQMGVKVEIPVMQKIQDERTETYLKGLREGLNQNVQLTVIIFPSLRDDKYSAIKKMCCVECPVPSQVINSRTISRPDKLRSIVQKIALQINCKLGGALWAVKIPFAKAMICGIDTYHDTKNRGQSVAGFVASLNPNVTRWHSQVFMQSSDCVMVNGLQTALANALQKYSEVNKFLPEVIICYRAGLGDGQLNVCKEYEVQALEKAFDVINPAYKPMLAVIVCQKRINTRIFLPKNGDFENPLPGLIVDHTITRRYLFDFFLVSQMVRQGTVTPTHYVVLHNTTTMDPDKIQRLTYKMCHLYYNWSGTIRVPAPCQYAHKLAHLVGSSIHKDPAQILCDSLFFL
ncbi:piwi-like protein Ago3 [Homalodisca vitripennis]|uniref:piwi-like protein Ago3 n=1 Tax=Homalodisca vitripennis TaxID=197043 RepID=UPI001EEA0716|nr:piwi-like protein Ago3 [Homalodisca vitripennis]XP_046683938.1 piwi-like protein Ago3 [Homalodisca vitripennis]